MACEVQIEPKTLGLVQNKGDILGEKNELSGRSWFQSVKSIVRIYVVSMTSQIADKMTSPLYKIPFLFDAFEKEPPFWVLAFLNFEQGWKQN